LYIVSLEKSDLQITLQNAVTTIDKAK